MKTAKIIGVGLAVALALPAAAQARSAGQFLRDAIKGDNSEIALGSLAQKRGHSSGVRSFGATLVKDHSKGKMQAVSAAKAEGVSVPRGMMPEAEAEYAKLKRLSPQAFDSEFAHYMATDHRKDIKEFEQQAKAGDRTTSRLAAQTLPTLRKHLQIAESLTGRR
jgi:putative membrane protein